MKKNKLLLVIMSLLTINICAQPNSFIKHYLADYCSISCSPVTFGINIVYDDVTKNIYYSVLGVSGGLVEQQLLVLDTNGFTTNRSIYTPTNVVASGGIVTKNNNIISVFNNSSNGGGAASDCEANIFNLLTSNINSISNQKKIIANIYGGVSTNIQITGVKTLNNGVKFAIGFCSIAGNKNGCMIMKFDSNNNFIWGKVINGEVMVWNYYLPRNQVDVDTLNNSVYFITSASNFSNDGFSAMQVIKTDLNGSIIWNKILNNPYQYDEGYVIKVLANQDIIVAGRSQGQNISVVRLNNVGSIIWEYKYQPKNGYYKPLQINGINLMPDGNILLTGYSGDYSYLTADNAGLLIELDLNGNIVWQNIYKSSLSNYGYYFVSSIIKGSSIYTSGTFKAYSESSNVDAKAVLCKTNLVGEITSNCNIDSAKYVKNSINLNIINIIGSSNEGTEFPASIILCNSPETTTITTVCQSPITTLVNSFKQDNYFDNVFPNPFTTNLNIENKTDIKRLSIFNNLGKVVVVKENINALITTVDLTSIAKGIYFLQLQTNEGTITKKIIKE